MDTHLFVLEASVIIEVNSKGHREGGKRERERESGRSGGRGLRQKHVSQSFLSVDCDKHV